MSDPWPRYLALGDSAITIALGEGISRELSGEVAQLTHALTTSDIEGILDIVPSYASLAVYFDLRKVAYNDLRTSLRGAVAQARARISSVGTDSQPGKTIRIPVRYDGEDLADVAARTGLSRDGIVDLHTSREYRVFVIGFVPGFAYLGELDQALVLPRRSTPRKRVPAGSVAIAETQTGVYPFSTPGGWHLIGTTRAPMFDPAAADPALLHVGDTVVFEATD